MIEIKLRKSDHVALISDQDAAHAAHEWSLSAALGVLRYDGERHVILAREITEAAEGSFVVHVDKDKRNCQRGNLLLLSRSQHAQFTRRSRGKTGLLGVSKDEQARPYKAELGGKYLGRFDTADEAAEAYDLAAIEKYGASAQLNEPEPFKVCRRCHTAHFVKCKKCTDS